MLKERDMGDWFYVPSWKRSDLLSSLEQKFSIQETEYWLIFQDPLGIGRELSDRLSSFGQNVISVSMGETFSNVNSKSYTVNPSSNEDYKALLNDLIDLGELPKRIVHLWAFDVNDTSMKDSESLLDKNRSGFYSLLYLVQALDAIESEEEFDITVMSNNAQDVTGEETLQAVTATMSVLCKVIPQEYPNLRCRNIDFCHNPSEELPKQFWIESMLHEISGNHQFPMVAHRGCHRWVQIFENVKTNDHSDEVPAILREKGVYLITGGLGNIGFILAKYLAKNLNPRLIMLGRTVLPPQRKWDDWINTHPDDDRVSRKILKIRELQNQGAEVQIYSVDVSNLIDMQTVLDECYAKFGVINGVIHAAGILDDTTFRTIPDTHKADCQRQYRAKMAGLLVLEKALGGKKIDFFLLTSSLSSVLGGFGYSSYAAANIFMDTYALRQKREKSLPWISVNFDAWNFEEQNNEDVEIDTTLDELAIRADEGEEVFRRVLSISMVPQIVISTGNLKNRIKRYIIQSPNIKHKSSGEQSSSSPRHKRMDLSTEYVVPENEIQTKVANVWQNMLGIENVGIQDNFFELGGHSLLATQIISRFYKLWNIQVPLRQFFDSPTIESIAIIVEGLVREAEIKSQDGQADDESREFFEI